MKNKNGGGSVLPLFFFVLQGSGDKGGLGVLNGKLHKAGAVLFRCTKIRKAKSACFGFSQSNVCVLNAPSMGR